jgi:hypothetical protein
MPTSVSNVASAFREKDGERDSAGGSASIASGGWEAWQRFGR